MCGIKFLSGKENALHQYPALQHHFYRILLGVDLGDGGRGEKGSKLLSACDYDQIFKSSEY